MKIYVAYSSMEQDGEAKKEVTKADTKGREGNDVSETHSSPSGGGRGCPAILAHSMCGLTNPCCSFLLLSRGLAFSQVKRKPLTVHP